MLSRAQRHLVTFYCALPRSTAPTGLFRTELCTMEISSVVIYLAQLTAWQFAISRRLRTVLLLTSCVAMMQPHHHGLGCPAIVISQVK
jgi:hypothetical protein